MKQAWLQVCTSVLIFQHFWAAADSFSHVCYMESPMKSPDALPFAKVDVDLCSHIIMGFATVGNDYSVDLNPIGGYEAITSFAELRKKRPSLKLMVSVGGGGDDKNFKEMTSTESNRQRFINSTAWALRTNDIDGIDLDWEFPEVSDAANFVSLLEEASVELKREPLHPLLLSVAVPAPVTLVLNRYHIPDISKSVDFVNLMTYDLHVYQWYLPFVDHNSPLFPRAGELPVLNMLNLVCALLKAGAQREYDAESKVPYLHEEKLWVSYDDQESVTLKALWIMSNGYGGTMTFSLNADDWQGKCGNDTFPLQKAISHTSDGSSAQGFELHP